MKALLIINGLCKMSLTQNAVWHTIVCISTYAFITDHCSYLKYALFHGFKERKYVICNIPDPAIGSGRLGNRTGSAGLPDPLDCNLFKQRSLFRFFVQPKIVVIKYFKTLLKTCSQRPKPKNYAL